MAFRDEVARLLATVTDAGARSVTVGDFAPTYGGIDRPYSVVLWPHGDGPEFAAVSSAFVDTVGALLLLGPGVQGSAWAPTMTMEPSKVTLNADTAAKGYNAPILTVTSNQEAGDQPTQLGPTWVRTNEVRGLSATLPPPDFPQGMSVGGGTTTRAETWGRVAITTDTAGQAVIPHGLGAAPGMVQVNPEGTQAYDVIAGTYTATGFTATVVTRSSGAAVGAGITITVCWTARR